MTIVEFIRNDKGKIAIAYARSVNDVHVLVAECWAICTKQKQNMEHGNRKRRDPSDMSLQWRNTMSSLIIQLCPRRLARMHAF